MQNKRENIYKMARKAAKLSREKAAEAVYISPRSLADYESGKTVPPDDVVCRMAEAYRARWLEYDHLKQTSPVGQRVLPDLDATNMPMAILMLQNEMDEVQRSMPDIVSMACGEGGEAQEQILNQIMRLEGACSSIRFCRQEKGALA